MVEQPQIVIKIVRLYVPGLIGIGFSDDRLHYKVWWLGPRGRAWLSLHTDDRGGYSIYSRWGRLRSVEGRRNVDSVKPLNKGGDDA